MALLALLLHNAPAAASGTDASLLINISINGEPAAASVGAYPAGSSTHHWADFIPDPSRSPSPLTMRLPAGNYQIHVRPRSRGESSTTLPERIIDLHLVPGQRRRLTVDFPAARLLVSARHADGSALSHAAVAVAPGWVTQVNGSRYRPLPAEFILPAGKYTVLAIDTRTRQRSTQQLTAKAGQLLRPTLVIKAAHTGTLTLQLRMDGQTVPRSEQARYIQSDITTTTDHLQVRPLSGGYGQPMVLPAGSYDISVHFNTLGVAAQQLHAIRIADGQQLLRRIDTRRPGTLILHGRWTGQPMAIAACARHANIFDSAHLGALMGGHSPSRGGCPDPVIGTLIATLSRHGSGGPRLDGINAAGPLLLLPGTYTITTWPQGQPALKQTLTDVDIAAGQTSEKTIQFRWPPE